MKGKCRPETDAMRYCVPFACLVGSLWATPGLAEITITRAEYAGGVLVVRGETSRRNQLVTLDGRYRTRTGRHNEFRFRIRYLPSDCSVTIRAGQEIRPARVANCDINLGYDPKRPQPKPR
jgi:hypothetical protein